MNKRLQKILDKYYDDFLSYYYYQDCPGCPCGHSSFWRTIIRSKEWQKWKEYAQPRMRYDFTECEELGMMSAGHWKDFIKFTRRK